MKKITSRLIAASLFLVAIKAEIGASSAHGLNSASFQSIFNGKDLNGWEGDPKYWSVEDGALTGVADGTLKQNSFITWRGGVVKNFELLVRVKITQGGNSGLQYRSAMLPDAGPYVMTGYQCDVVSNRDDYDGMLYEERGRRILAHTGEKVVIDETGQNWVVGSTGEVKHFQAGEWREYRVLVEGNHHRHWIDGHPTVDVVDHDPKGRRLEGLLGVQVHVGPAMKVQFKDWRLKTLPNKPLLKPEQTPIPPNAPKVVPQGASPKKA